MFKNYLKVAWRNIVRHKGYSFISIFGLAIGLAVCLLVFIYVGYEFSYDLFLANHERIYRVPVIWGKGEGRMQFAGALPALAEAVQREIPEVELAGRVQADRDATLVRQKEKFKEENFFFVDPSILKIFSFAFLAGDGIEALTEPFSLLISEKQARKYFGTQRAVGQTLQYGDRLLKVTGVFKSFPDHTHLLCDFLVSYATLAAMGRKPDAPWNQWGDDLTYFLLKKNAAPQAIAGKLQRLLARNAGDWFAAQMELLVQPLSAIHWDVESRGDVGPKGNRLYLYLFTATALLLMLVACFNFASLIGSRCLARQKEVGIRKAIGASRRQLVGQFLCESMMQTAAALMIGWLLFWICQQLFYRFLDVRITFAAPQLVSMCLLLAAMFVFVGIFAAICTALLLPRLQAADAVKKLDQTKIGKMSFRQPLLIVQFAIAIILISGSVVFFRQLHFVRTTDLGFERRGVALIFFANADFGQIGKYAAFRDELLNNTAIDSVSGAFTVPSVNSRMQMSINKKGFPLDKGITICVLPADFAFVKTLGLKIATGRDFSTAYSLDASRSVILNEAAVSSLALKEPLGETLIIPADGAYRDVQVIGVVRNFHFRSLHQKIEPCLILIKPDSFVLAAVRMCPGAEAAALAHIRKTWRKVFGAVEFNLKYLTERYDSLYRSEERSGILLVLFMILVMFLSCVGLLGLASFVISRHTREIGLRKVFGASIFGIVRLLLLRLVGWLWISCLIAWPVAYYFSAKWLAGFAYRIDLHPLIFIAAGAAGLVMALLTSSVQSLRAACANPVESLRYE